MGHGRGTRQSCVASCGQKGCPEDPGRAGTDRTEARHVIQDRMLEGAAQLACLSRMKSEFYSNTSEIPFLENIKDNLRRCEQFAFSVSFIKNAGLLLLKNDIEAALNRGVKGRLITSTYQNFTDIESLNYLHCLMGRYPGSFSCHLDHE